MSILTKRYKTITRKELKMQKKLSYNYEVIDLKDYKPMGNFLSNENDITLYSIYRLINDLEKVTKVEYKTKVTYSVVRVGYNKVGEVLRKIDIQIFMKETDDRKIENINKIVDSIQDKNGKTLLKAYDNDFIIIHVVNNNLCIYHDYNEKQNYRDYENKSEELIDIKKSNFEEESVRFLVSEEIDKITGKVYKTNMTQALNLFYKLLEKDKIEFTGI